MVVATLTRHDATFFVDQHFHNRNRMARLMTAIAAHPDKIGIGIDEDTVAIFEPNNTFPLCKLDAGLLEQIIHNIIHNALTYTPENSIIKIEAFVFFILVRFWTKGVHLWTL